MEARIKSLGKYKYSKIIKLRMIQKNLILTLFVLIVFSACQPTSPLPQAWTCDDATAIITGTEPKDIEAGGEFTIIGERFSNPKPRLLHFTTRIYLENPSGEQFDIEHQNNVRDIIAPNNLLSGVYDLYVVTKITQANDNSGEIVREGVECTSEPFSVAVIETQTTGLIEGSG